MKENLIVSVYLQVILRHYKRLIYAGDELEVSRMHFHNAQKLFSFKNGVL